MIAVLYVPFPTETLAVQISQQLLDEKLIACANLLGPIRSLFVWQGKQEDNQEFPVLFKTRLGLQSVLADRIRQLHSYECPCLLQFSIQEVNADYLRWIEESTKNVIT